MKKKHLGLVAAALLAVTPVANMAVNAAQANVVQAADDDQTATLWLKKKTPYLTAKNGESVEAFIKQPIRDVTSNVGKVTNMVGIAVYHNMDNGDPDYTKAMDLDDTLRKGKSYSAVVTFNVKNGKNYSRLLQNAMFSDLSGYDEFYINILERSGSDVIPRVFSPSELDWTRENQASIIIPIKVGSNTSTSAKTATVKHNAYIYNKNGKRALRTLVLKKNHTVKVIKTVKIKNKKYAQIGKNQFVKWTNLSK